MEKINLDGMEYMRLSDLYEWTIENLQTNEFTLEEQERMLSNLQNLDYLKEIMKNDNIKPIIMNKVIEGIRDNTMPSDCLSISYIYYVCKTSGLDVTELRHQIDTNAERIVNNYFNS